MAIPINLIRIGLTALGVIGVPVTSWISVKCHEKANDAEDKKSKFKCYIPAIISGIATSGCIIGSHKVSSKEIAALTATATYAVANRDKLEKVVTEKVGKEESQKIKHEAQKDIQKKVPNGASIEWTGHGTLKVLEGYSGRMFYSSMEAVINAENRLNKEFQSGQYVSMNDFYSYLGIGETHFGHQFGWVPDEIYYDRWFDDNPIGFENHMVNDENGDPLLVIEVYNYPMEGWMEV